MGITGFTGTGQLDDSVNAEEINRQIVIPVARARAVLDNFVGAFGRHDTISGSLSKSYPRLGKITFSTSLTQGTDATPGALSDSQVSATVAEEGGGVAYGDLLKTANSMPGGRAYVASELGKAYADRIETLLLALSNSLTDHVGTSVALTPDVFLQAIHECDENEVDGPLGCVLYTTAIDNLRVAQGGSTAAVLERQEILDRIGPAAANGYVQRYYEVAIFKSTNVPTCDTAAGRMGMMFPMNAQQFPIVRLIGVNQENGQAWDGLYSEERDESGRLTEMWVVGQTGVALVAPDFGCGVQSIT